MYFFLKRPCIPTPQLKFLLQDWTKLKSGCNQPVGPDVHRALVKFSPNPGSLMVHSMSVYCQQWAPEGRKLKVVHIYTWFTWSTSRDSSFQIHSVPSDHANSKLWFPGWDNIGWGTDNQWWRESTADAKKPYYCILSLFCNLQWGCLVWVVSFFSITNYNNQ